MNTCTCYTIWESVLVATTITVIVVVLVVVGIGLLYRWLDKHDGV